MHQLTRMYPIGQGKEVFWIREQAIQGTPKSSINQSRGNGWCGPPHSIPRGHPDRCRRGSLRCWN